MKHLFARLTILLLFSLLGACANLPDGGGCAGTVIAPPSGLVETSDLALLASAIDTPGKGKLCKGKVFVVEKEVTVYRVWDAAKAYTLYGGWWSFSLPTGPRDKYREENDICPEWSALDKMSSCVLKIGAHVVVGPGQSAQCNVGLLPASPTNQVYVANDSRNNVLFVEKCSAGADWPAHDD
jgi:hypothetical protein